MRCLPFLLVLWLLVGCASPVDPPASTFSPPVVQPTLITNLPNQSIVLTLLKASSEFDTFNVVRTNENERVNFKKIIHVLDMHISTVDCNTTTLKNELSIGGPIILVNLNSVFNLLEYYTQVQTNCLPCLQAVKTGIEQGLAE